MAEAEIKRIPVLQYYIRFCYSGVYLYSSGEVPYLRTSGIKGVESFGDRVLQEWRCFFFDKDFPTCGDENALIRRKRARESRLIHRGELVSCVSRKCQDLGILVDVKSNYCPSTLVRFYVTCDCVRCDYVTLPVNPPCGLSFCDKKGVSKY